MFKLVLKYESDSRRPWKRSLARLPGKAKEAPRHGRGGSLMKGINPYIFTSSRIRFSGLRRRVFLLVKIVRKIAHYTLVFQPLRGAFLRVYDEPYPIGCNDKIRLASEKDFEDYRVCFIRWASSPKTNCM